MFSDGHTSESRMEICRSCEYFAGMTCNICSCVMILKTKIPNAKCPKGKWGKKAPWEA